MNTWKHLLPFCHFLTARRMSCRSDLHEVGASLRVFRDPASSYRAASAAILLISAEVAVGAISCPHVEGIFRVHFPIEFIIHSLFIIINKYFH